MAFSPDSKTVVSAAESVRLWDPRAGAGLTEPLVAHTDWVEAVAFDARGGVLASAENGVIRLWDAETRRGLGGPLTGRGLGINDVALSPEGKTLAAASRDSAIWMWDLKKRPVTAERHPGTPPVRSVAFSQDGGTLASSGDGPTVLLWEVKTRRRLATLTGHGCCAVNSAIFHPDGHTLVSAGEDKQLRVWDLRTRRPIARIASGSDVRDMAFSPDGEVLATVGSELRLWDFDGRHLKLRRFPARVSSAAVAISPDGKTIAIASGSAVMLRDLRSGRELGLPLASHTDSVTDVAFSPDGKMLATGSHDKAVRLWDSILWSDGRRLRDHICRAVGHSLDRTQWAELAPGLPYRETCPRP